MIEPSESRPPEGVLRSEDLERLGVPCDFQVDCPAQIHAKGCKRFGVEDTDWNDPANRHWLRYSSVYERGT